ncbi:MAG: hypothetical protein RLZ16_543 [Bacteroidota bacterium]|jgi:hypothetical protein
MKLFLIPVILIGIYVVFQSFMSVYSTKTEKQPYRVVLKDADLEIRFYPAATMATIYSKATSYKTLSSNGFNKLAKFIFGGNEQKESISMTAPVRMSLSEKGSSMSFVMPEKYATNKLPTPNDKNIQIQKSQPEYVAVIGFSGYANDEKINEYRNKLAQILTKRKIRTKGDFNFLGYNAPFQFLGRTNEIVIPIEWTE